MWKGAFRRGPDWLWWEKLKVGNLSSVLDLIGWHSLAVVTASQFLASGSGIPSLSPSTNLRKIRKFYASSEGLTKKNKKPCLKYGNYTQNLRKLRKFTKKNFRWYTVSQFLKPFHPGKSWTIKKELFSSRFELETFSVLDWCDNQLHHENMKCKTIGSV